VKREGNREGINILERCLYLLIGTVLGFNERDCEKREKFWAASPQMGLEIGFLRNKSIAHYEDTPCYQLLSTIKTIVLRKNLIVASLVMKFSILWN
jgi:hypothetical protein